MIIKAEYFDGKEITGSDLEHIARMIEATYICGELIDGDSRGWWEIER